MSWYEVFRNYYLCLDPVHVGAGGYRLGRVDNTIVREPGTGLPKVPGTSLSGAARSYAAMQCGRIDAAGLHKEAREKDYKHCPILYTFGTASDDAAADGSKAGAVSISDARLLFYPVASTDGPLWITTPDLLAQVGLKLTRAPVVDDEGQCARVTNVLGKEVAAGWMRFPISGIVAWDKEDHALKNAPEWSDIKDRVLIVSPKFFSALVNNNLEVRTSVSIKPETGAAEDKHLFTYEAIPRAAWLFGDVTVDDYMNQFPKSWTDRELGLEDWTGPKPVVQAGLGLIEYLGVGGMGTRGFGRMRRVAEQSIRGAGK